jgi:RNA-directed DNA polymerase
VRIDDRAFLRLLQKWLQAGILETDGHVIHPESGTPQGGTGSPVLANASLHYALDVWFAKVVKAHCRGEALLCRYADDWVCACRYQDDADRFYRVLDRHGVQRVKRRTARKKLQVACRRITAWIKQHRHLPGREFYRRLNTRLQGHYNYYGLHGNARATPLFREGHARRVQMA